MFKTNKYDNTYLAIDKTKAILLARADGVQTWLTVTRSVYPSPSIYSSIHLFFSPM